MRKEKGKWGAPTPTSPNLKSSAGDKGTGPLRCLLEQEALIVEPAPAQ